MERAAQPSALSSSGQIPALQALSQQENLIPLTEGERPERLWGCACPCGGVGRVWDMELMDILEAEQGDPSEGGAGKGWEGGSQGPAGFGGLT